MAYRTTVSLNGTRQEHVELGASLRFTSPNRGLTFGYKAVKVLSPHVIETNDGVDLAAQLLRRIEPDSAPAPESKTITRGFLYRKLPVEPLPSVLYSRYAGMDVTLDSTDAALNLGLGSRLRYLNFPLTGADSVQLHTMAPGAESLILWIVRPHGTTSLSSSHDSLL